jgi:hypothetical protein
MLMKIAFVHYHLKVGGVGSVLKRQVEAISSNCDTLVLTGDRATMELPCKIVEIPGLGYDRPEIAAPSPQQVADKIRRAVFRRWPHGCDVLHVHNPLLAKNKQFLKIVALLQQEGMNLFLQIHDFAEDGRPHLYFSEPYPANCHYGVINTRDAGILQKAGLDKKGVHCLYNAVEDLSVDPSRRAKPCVLYPVRAIRRKNIGEAILLSLFFEKGYRLAITQPPNSPVDIESYRDWVRWVKDNHLSVDFDVGKKGRFIQIMRDSASVVTTSIAEGFGLSYLEPWTAGKLLWGRRLSDVCRDFEEKGVEFQSLYDALQVPLSWLNEIFFSHRWKNTVFQAARQYGNRVAAATVDRAYNNCTAEEKVDFGLLDELSQRQVLRRLVCDPQARQELAGLNPWLTEVGTIADRSGTIEKNRRIILNHYGSSDYGKRLMTIYDKVVNCPIRHRIDKKILCDAFFNLQHFSLLTWGAYTP